MKFSWVKISEPESLKQKLECTFYSSVPFFDLPSCILTLLQMGVMEKNSLLLHANASGINMPVVVVEVQNRATNLPIHTGPIATPVDIFLGRTGPTCDSDSVLCVQ